MTFLQQLKEVTTIKLRKMKKMMQLVSRDINCGHQIQKNVLKDKLFLIEGLSLTLQMNHLNNTF